MTDIPEALAKARQLIEQEKDAEALGILGAITSRTFEVAMLSGVAANRSGQLERAAEHFSQACELEPTDVGARLNLALTLRAMGQNDIAEAKLREARGLDPTSLPVNLALGNLAMQNGQFSDAEDCFSHVLQTAPSHVGALNNSGICLSRLGRREEAAGRFEAVLSQEPANLHALSNLGAIRSEQGRSGEAIELLKRVLDVAPGQIEAANNLGVALLDNGNAGEAAAVLRPLVLSGDVGAEVYSNLGNALVKLGDTSGAADAYDQALAIGSEGGISIKRALLLPMICATSEEMDAARGEFEQRIDTLIASPPTLKDPFEEVGVPSFNLSYQDHNNSRLLEKLSNLYLAASPSLAFTAEHCGALIAPRLERPVRIGFISRFFQSNSVGRCFHGVVRFSNRDDVHITAFTFSGDVDPLWNAIESDVDRAVLLPTHLDAARRQIAEEKLDVLVFTDIGMDPLTYFLAYSRLAPLQCALGGHPDAIGLASIDAYVSCDLQEPDNAETHYRAHLVRLPGAPTYYERPDLPAPLKPRAEFDLPEGRPLYFCGQTLIKVHPDMDALFLGILESDPEGILLFPEGYTPELAALLKNRFQKTFKGLDDRIQFLPAMSHNDYMNVMALADVSLDTRPFGGGNTSWQAIAVGTPMVSWPGEFLRGRYTQALYRLMGIEDSIAVSAQDYIERSVRFGTDKDFAADFNARVEERADSIFCDRVHVDSLYSYLVERANAAH